MSDDEPTVSPTAAPTPPTRPVLDAIIAPDWGQWVHDATVHDYTPPGCIVSQPTFQSATSGVFLVVPWATKVRDPYGYHTTGSRLTVPAGLDGLHLVSIGIQFGNNGAGTQRYAEILVNGAALTPAMAVASPHMGAQYVFITLTQAVMLAPGAYLEVRALQDSGSGVGVQGWCSLLRLGAA